MITAWRRRYRGRPSWIDRRKTNSVRLFFFFLSLSRTFSSQQDGFRRRIAPIGGRFCRAIMDMSWASDRVSGCARIYAGSLGSDRSVIRRVRLRRASVFRNTWRVFDLHRSSSAPPWATCFTTWKNLRGYNFISLTQLTNRFSLVRIA